MTTLTLASSDKSDQRSGNGMLEGPLSNFWEVGKLRLKKIKSRKILAYAQMEPSVLADGTGRPCGPEVHLVGKPMD
jgi:hypothetical protein